MKSVRFLISLALVFNASFLLAQPGDPGGGNPTVPITGVEILLVAGAALGIKHLYSKNKKQN